MKKIIAILDVDAFNINPDLLKDVFDVVIFAKFKVGDCSLIKVIEIGGEK